MTDDIDALMQAALYGPEDAGPESGADREVLSFIRMFNIKEAPNPIPFILIFEMFKKHNPKSHLGKQLFRNAFNKRFTPSRNARSHYYRLDPTPFGLPLSYSVYTDSRFFTRTTGRTKKYGPKAKKQKHDQEQKQDPSRKAEDA